MFVIMQLVVHWVFPAECIIGYCARQRAIGDFFFCDRRLIPDFDNILRRFAGRHRRRSSFDPRGIHQSEFQLVRKDSNLLNCSTFASLRAAHVFYGAKVASKMYDDGI